MPEKQKNAKSARKHKESQHKNNGGGKVTLSPIEKILICNGGMAHKYLRSGQSRISNFTSPKRRGGKARVDS